MGQILLVRHGQASWGAEDYDQLSDDGWEQSRLLGEALRSRGFWPDRVISGGMRRHLDTCAAAGFGEPDVDRDWDEFDHVGMLAAVPPPEGEMTPEVFQESFEAATQRWTGGEHDDYPESFVAFGSRVLTGLRAAAEDADKVVVFTSGGPIAWVTATLLLPEEPEVAPRTRAGFWRRLNRVCANSGVTKCVTGRRGMTLVSFNEHTHLDGVPDLITYR